MPSLFVKNRLLVMSIFSGILFSLSWPAGGVPFLIFVAFLPLLLVEDHIFKNKDDFGRYTLFFYAWIAFLVFNVLTTWWIVYASVPGMLMAVILNSFFMAIAFSLVHLSRRVLPGRQGVVSLLIFWLSFEYLHLDWELSWSWLNLGNAFASIPRWVQWYEYTGTLGGTAWVLIMNITFFEMYKAYHIPVQTIKVEHNLNTGDGQDKQQMETYLRNYAQMMVMKKRAFAGLAALLFLVVPSALSWYIGSNYTPTDDPVEVVVVQPGRDPYLRPQNPAQSRQWTDSIVMLARQEISPQTRFVVVPEASLPGPLWLNSPEEHYGYRTLLEHAAGHDSLTWVAGVMMYRQYAEGEEPTPTARTMPDDLTYYDFYNAALYVDSEGDTDTYFKSKLVPGVERMPFAKYLTPLGKLVESFGGTAGGMGVQYDRAVFTGPDGTRVAPVICYESIYGNYLNDYIRNGAQLIFIVTNDGWWRDTPGHRQHNQYARLRAIETRRSIARAAKTGISGFIDQKGKLLTQTDWWEPTVIKAQLHKNNKLTYYVRNGDYIGRLALFLMALLALYMATQGFLRKKSKI